jgi:hypothetical protein
VGYMDQLGMGFGDELVEKANSGQMKDSL